MNKNTKRNNKNNSGITLVALVITVIVMLILAGVAISVLTNDGGLFDKTIAATDKYKEASEDEANMIAKIENNIEEYLLYVSDKEAPNEFYLKVTRTDTSLTVTGETTDNGVAGLKGYQFKLDDSLGTTVVADWTPVQEETSYTFTQEEDGIQKDVVYRASMRAIDWAGNMRLATNSAGNPSLISKVVEIGDYINYNAGEWIESDFNKITSSEGFPKVNKSASVPSSQGEFGGFVEGQSRDTNSISGAYSGTWLARSAGWRVWDIEGDVVTLISAGNPETYYHSKGYADTSSNILKKRDCSMYLNEYSTEAKFLTGQEVARWYSKQYNTNVAITERGGEGSSMFIWKTFPRDNKIDVLECGAYLWLATACNGDSLYLITPDSRYVSRDFNHPYGVRVLITLKSDVFVSQGSKNNEWIIAK